MADNGLTDGCDERARLPTTVLRLGELLGWGRQEVMAFTEALTGRRWHNCRREEFEAVLEEYRAMGRVIQAKVARRSERGERDQLERRDHHAPFE
ncbi:MAG: hypothetical protein JOZ41_11185 [Chloroflexi bacterium]|nr:hypothetical protein [Chloroflexota bacterium]